LKGLDPAFKDKEVVWRIVEEVESFTMQMVQDLFADKVKVVTGQITEVVDTSNKLKTFFPSEKQQNLFIVLSRLPKADIFISALETLNDKAVSLDNLESLMKNWPSDEYEGLLAEANSDPDAKWDKTEEYFIKLGLKKKFDVRINLWIFKLKYPLTLKMLEDNCN
jgi:hypothetical protein